PALHGALPISQIDAVVRRHTRCAIHEPRRRQSAERTGARAEQQAAPRQLKLASTRIVRVFIRHNQIPAVATFSAIRDIGSCRAWMARLSLAASEALSASV